MRREVCLVRLDGLKEPQFVPKQVMTALGLRDQSDTWPTSLLVDHLRSRRLLLLLDNCEHVLDACATLVDRLLEEVPGVRILATSRQPLGVEGEHVVPVPPLALPEAGESASLQRFARVEAIELFLARAKQQTGARLRLAEENRHTVAEICRRLDGMPLAIELAAVTLRTLGLEEVLERLNRRFDLPTRGNRTALPRHHTLRATIDWSYELLPEPERVLFRRLSAFAGTFDLEAVEAVCGWDDLRDARVLDLLSSLVDRSLVSRDGGVARARYRLHETVREYALERLERAGGEAAAIADSHLRHYAALCNRLDMAWFSPHVIDSLARIELDADNVRAALGHCLEDAVHPDRGLDLAGSLWEFWATRALGEGVHWLESVLRRPGWSGAPRARALFARGLVALHQPDLMLSVDALTEAATLARQAQDVRTLVNILGLRSTVHALAGQVAQAKAVAAELSGLVAASPEPSYLYQAAASDVVIASIEDDLPRARDAYKEGESLSKRHGELWLRSWNAVNLALVMLRHGEYVEVGRLLREALPHKYDVDDRSGVIAILEGLASQAAGVGDCERAARLLGAAAAQHRELGTRHQPVIGPFIEQAGAQAAGSLGAGRFQAAFTYGANLDRRAAVAYACGENSAPELDADSAER